MAPALEQTAGSPNSPGWSGLALLFPSLLVWGQARRTHSPGSLGMTMQRAGRVPEPVWIFTPPGSQRAREQFARRAWPSTVCMLSESCSRCRYPGTNWAPPKHQGALAGPLPRPHAAKVTSHDSAKQWENLREDLFICTDVFVLSLHCQVRVSLWGNRIPSSSCQLNPGPPTSPPYQVLDDFISL